MIAKIYLFILVISIIQGLNKMYTEERAMYKKISSFALFLSSLLLCSSCKGEIGITTQYDDFTSGNPTEETLLVGTIPQDFIYKERHYRMLQSVGIKTIVEQEEIGNLLGCIIREDDISDFILEYPNVDYVIDNYVYDRYNNNRVPFYMVVGYEDLSFISVKNFLYQDVTNFPN